jgi:hypothetical protein
LVQRKIPFFLLRMIKRIRWTFLALVEYFIQLGAGFGIHQRTVRKVLDRGARCRENTLDSRHQSALLSILHTTYRARVYYNGFSLSVYVSWWIVYTPVGLRSASETTQCGQHNSSHCQSGYPNFGRNIIH